METCIAKALNKQIVIELDAAYLYLQMAEWLEQNDLSGFGNWLRKQAHEEVGHAMLLFNFLKDRDAVVALGSVRRQKYFFASVKDVMDKLLAQGKYVASNVRKILELAQSSEDAKASVLLAWLAAVQLEEEELVTNVLVRVNNCYRSAIDTLQEIDSELAKRQDTIPTLLKAQRKHGVA